MPTTRSVLQGVLLRKKQEGLIDKFDLDLWSSLVDYATVYAPENIVFTFVNGAEIKA